MTIATALLLWLAMQGDDSPQSRFRAEIEPILVERCLGCHGDSPKGGLDLRSRRSLFEVEMASAPGEFTESPSWVVPGQPQESHLFERVRAGDMPPDSPLDEEDVEAIRRWIEDGAYFPDRALDPFVRTTKSRGGYDWWSLQPLADPVPPDASFEESPGVNAIDAFIDESLLARDLTPSEPASKRELIRRATFDLTGLPPQPDDVEAFLEDDTPEAYERLIDRLLASPHYGERWGRHWLDVIRFGESRGFERNEIINNIWPFRDYIIRSFNDDKPFDRLIREHLAGDVLEPGNPDVEVGTAFLVCGPYDDVGNQDAAQAAQIRANTIDDMIRATAEGFLGLTVGCSRCHDHKFDPVSQHDYYRLYATFSGVHHGSRVVASEEDKKAHRDRRQPLLDERQSLGKREREIEKGIEQRAQARSDFYERLWTRPPVDRKGTVESFEPVEARFVRLVVESSESNPGVPWAYTLDEIQVWTAEDPPRNVALRSNGGRAYGIARTARDFDGAYSADLTIDGAFGARFHAQDPVLTVELKNIETVEKVVFSSDGSGAAGDHGVARFVADYRLEVSLNGESWMQVASSVDRKPVNDAHRRHRYRTLEATDQEKRDLEEGDRAYARVQRELAKVTPLPSWWVGQFKNPPKLTHVFLGGDPQRPGDEITPGGLDALLAAHASYALPADSPEGERRLALADWIASPKNPLTWRVLANRLWHYHFGQGLVSTPSDLGFMGERPSHPQLLDWLASRLIAEGFRLKPLHKAIMMSRTYRQSSRHRAEAFGVDGRNRLLWRFTPRRLTAEEVRDSMLSVAGLLSPDEGGPGFRLYRYLQDNVSTYVPLDDHGPETYRRAVYHQNARATRIDLLTEFDCPDSALASPRRARTTTASQALAMMNHSWTLTIAEALATRVNRETQEGPQPARVRRTFDLLYGRPPSEEEEEACLQVLRDHGARALNRAMLNTTEFLYVH